MFISSYISRGSQYETLTLLEILKMRGYITDEMFHDLEMKSNEIAKMLKGLVNSVYKSM